MLNKIALKDNTKHIAQMPTHTHQQNIKIE